MKKSLIAFAVLSTFAAAASAQSSVTLYGNVDVSAKVLTKQKGNKVGGKDTFSANKFSIDSGELSTSRFGLKGSEALDNDLSARFQVESAIGVDTGTAGASGNQFFNRRATVGVVSKSMGALDIGRQTTVDFDAISSFDPSGYYSSGSTGSNPNARIGGAVGRKDNSIKVTSASFSGVVVAANYAAGELIGNTGAYQGLSATYTEGPLAVVAGASQTNNVVSGQAATKGAFFGGKFAINEFTFKATVSQVKTGLVKTTVLGAGADYALDKATTLTAAYYNVKGVTPRTKVNEAVGIAKYALSNRTTAYASLTYAKGSPAASAGLIAVNSAVRAAVGVNHTF